MDTRNEKKYNTQTAQAAFFAVFRQGDLWSGFGYVRLGFLIV
jgi:hypothetical protein